MSVCDFKILSHLCLSVFHLATNNERPTVYTGMRFVSNDWCCPIDSTNTYGSRTTVQVRSALRSICIYRWLIPLVSFLVGLTRRTTLNPNTVVSRTSIQPDQMDDDDDTPNIMVLKEDDDDNNHSDRLIISKCTTFDIVTHPKKRQRVVWMIPNLLHAILLVLSMVFCSFCGCCRWNDVTTIISLDDYFVIGMVADAFPIPVPLRPLHHYHHHIHHHSPRMNNIMSILTTSNSWNHHILKSNHRDIDSMSIGDASQTTLLQPQSSTAVTYTVSNINHIQNIPRHIALVCDGNTRWAKQHQQPTIMGHYKGANRTIELIQTLRQSQSSLSQTNHSIYSAITHLTLYAFSTENWNRPRHEIQNLFRIVEQTANYWYHTLQQEDNDDQHKELPHQQRSIIIKFIGNLDDPRIPQSLRSILYKLQNRTPTTTKYNNTYSTTTTTTTTVPPPPLTVCIAMNYGGRQDIVRASQRLMIKLLQERNATTTIHENDIQQYITEANLHSCLDTYDLPDPDLLIRTSGEVRLSNFLLWNVAYTELYFTHTYWPDFNMDEFHTALVWYSQRQRRFGGKSLENQVVGEVHM